MEQATQALLVISTSLSCKLSKANTLSLLHLPCVRVTTVAEVTWLLSSMTANNPHSINTLIY